MSAEEWQKRRDLFTNAAAVRCDAFCELITCGNPTTPHARVMKLGGKPYLSLPLQSCDGSTPAEIGWIADQLESDFALKAGCLPRGLPAKNAESKKTDFPTIELIER